MEPIILASESPRRQGFFRLLNLPFTCMPAMIDETARPGLSPRQVTEDLALRKTMAIVEKLNNTPHPFPAPHSPSPNWVFGADTIVVLDGIIYGKADNRDDAKVMLGKLAGRRHEVISAMALYNGHKKTTNTRSVSCQVDFVPLSEAEIEWYLDTDEWKGAAGSYQLQGLGGCLIEAIHGSPSAVAGLPLHDFYAMLRANGYRYGG